MEERQVDRLSRYIITLLTVLAVSAVCWFFRSVIVCVIAAAVVALIGRPVFRFFSRLGYNRVRVPVWLSSVLTLVVVFACITGIVYMVSPVISNIAKDISKANIGELAQAAAFPLSKINQTLIKTFPDLGTEFRIESYVLEQVQGILDVSVFSSFLGSMASFAASLGIGLFSTVFIAFFFIKSPNLFSNIIVSFVPDHIEQKTRDTLQEIDGLISRYLIGLITEVLGVTVLNFLGLLIIARMGFSYSIGIAFVTGLLNVVPYIGPLFGGIIGVSLSLIIKYACATSFGLSVGFGLFVAILVGIFVFTQMIDNYLFQPLIYSNSIRAHPLEIFIVFLVAAQLGGMIGMLVAIPSYTVIRTFATRFYGDSKPIKRLMTNN